MRQDQRTARQSDAPLGHFSTKALTIALMHAWWHGFLPLHVRWRRLSADELRCELARREHVGAFIRGARS